MFFMKKQMKTLFLFFALFIICAFLHNAIWGLFRIEEPVFFVLALMFFVALIVSIFYNLGVWVRKTKKKKKN
jgi:hypothetical protein